MICFDGGKKQTVDVLFYFLQFFIFKFNVRHLNIFIVFFIQARKTPSMESVDSSGEEE
jgi:hypothetical protein